jgi:hypothetical protein
MDDLIIPKHALDEMQRDSLTEDDVYAVVRDYDESIEQDTGRREYARELDDGRYVVVVIEDGQKTVVTVWWNKRRGRRRRR